jgi:UDP-N-acetylglucosamine diphosphorylase/glucosamine-1-phosphate N-acetyltransferase
LRLVIFEDNEVDRLYPLTLTRPAGELRCGFATLYERIARTTGLPIAGYFVRDYIAPTFRQRANGVPVNAPNVLMGDDVLLVNARLLAIGSQIGAESRDHAIWVAQPPEGSGHPNVGRQLAWLCVSAKTMAPLADKPIAEVVAALAAKLDATEIGVTLVDYLWNLIQHNPTALVQDFAALGKSGVEGRMHEMAVVVGDRKHLWVAPGATVHPFVAIDVSGGPVVIDEGAEVHPHTRIEGPGYIGKKTIIVGGKIREGCSIGPVCRVGGEVEESIIHGYSNKYHDGFLGHAYVGEWVNLGALTTNSDLKNDYSGVKVYVRGAMVDSEDTKVGSFIGDHTKTSIGTLFNTGTVVGCMVNCVAHGGLMPKFIPSCALVIKGAITRGQRFQDILTTARTAMGRRKREMTEADQALLEHVRKLTRPELMEASKRDRAMLVQS